VAHRNKAKIMQLSLPQASIKTAHSRRNFPLSPFALKQAFNIVEIKAY